MPVPKIQGVNSQTRRDIPSRVFVYGTLKKGFSNHEHFLKEAKELGTASIEGLMFHLGAFPAVNLSERFTRIHGEVYQVNWDQLVALDGLEGVAHGFYDRIEAQVDPHGIVWMYIFAHQRAAREQFLIPSGVWRGTDTPKMKWAGFGKGVEIGSFETRSAQSEIKVGAGTSDYVLRRSPLDGSYKLINKKTREVIGSYIHLREMLSKEEPAKTILSLPRPTLAELNAKEKEEGSKVSRVGSTVRDIVHQHPSTPIVWSDGSYVIEPKEVKIPQAARILGIKYGEA